MALVRNPEHDYERGRGRKGWYRCTRCGKPTQTPERDTSWCSGLKQSGPRSAGDAHLADPEVYGAYHQWIGTLRCLLQERSDHRCAGRVTGHHVRSVGAGGKDVGNEVPLCERFHREVHRIGRRTFEDRYGLDLAAEATRLSAQAPPGLVNKEGSSDTDPLAGTGSEANP